MQPAAPSLSAAGKKTKPVRLMEKTDESAPPLSFHFAPEIEQALVSLCFYAPERIAVLKRELDVEVHFTRPELRNILEAIQLAYYELGQSDFASVITTL